MGKRRAAEYVRASPSPPLPADDVQAHECLINKRSACSTLSGPRYCERAFIQTSHAREKMERWYGTQDGIFLKLQRCYRVQRVRPDSFRIPFNGRLRSSRRLALPIWMRNTSSS